MLFHPAALRNGETSAGFGITIATAWRYVSETVALPAARSPKLRRALAAGAGGGQEDRACLCGDRWQVNPHRPGGCRPAALLRQAPPPRNEPPGHLRRELAASGLIVLADKGYAGAGEHVHVPTGAGTSAPPAKRPTAPAPSCALLANARARS